MFAAFRPRPLSIRSTRNFITNAFVPPNVDSLARNSIVAGSGEVASAANPARVKYIVQLYKNLPKGPAPEREPYSNPIARYLWKNTIKDYTLKPLIHFIIGVSIMNYTLQYQHHLKYHKKKEHH